MGSLGGPGGRLDVDSRRSGVTGAGCRPRSRAGGSLGRCTCVTWEGGAGFGRVSTSFGGVGSICCGNVIGADSRGVGGMGSGTASTSGASTGSGDDSGGGGGVGSGTGTTASNTGEDGWERGTGTCQACQPNESTASPTTCSPSAVRRAEKNGVRITRLASFLT